MVRVVATTLLLTLLAGCSIFRSDRYSGPVPTTREIPSFSDPRYRSVRFDILAVDVDTTDLIWRHRIENLLAGELHAGGVRAETRSRLLPPTRNWAQAAADSVFARYSVDAVLVVVMQRMTVYEHYIPQSHTVTTKRESRPKSKKDSTHIIETETVTTKTDGGYMQRLHQALYRMTLIDRRTGDTAWVATDQLDRFSDSDLEEFAARTVGQLIRDGMVNRSMAGM